MDLCSSGRSQRSYRGGDSSNSSWGWGRCRKQAPYHSLHGFVFVFGALTTLAVSGDHKAGAGKETPSPPHLGQNHLPAGLTCSALDATGNRIPLPNTHLQRRPQKPNHSHVKHLSVFSHHTNSSQQTWGESKCVSS